MKIYILLFLICNYSVCLSQDVLIKVNGDSIPSKIIKVSNEKIIFKKTTNPDGPQYEIVTDSVYKIKYQNNQEELYNIKAVQRKKIIKSPDDAISKGNNVLITSIDAVSKKGEKYFIDKLNYWDYWNIVEEKNKAHFIIELTIEKRGLGFFRMWATFKTIDGLEFKKSKYFKTSVNAFNGYNAAKDLSKKLVEDYFKKEFR